MAAPRPPRPGCRPCPAVGLAACCTALLAAAGVAAAPLADPPVGGPAPAFSAPGADGRAHALSDYAGRIVVLEWTSPACPFTAAKYRDGVMQALQRRAAARGVAWLAVDTGAAGKPSYLTAAAANARLRRLHARVDAFLLDRDGSIGRAYGARTTPSFFIVARDGRLAYKGAIDDDGAATGKVAHNYVRAALDDLAAGRPVRTPVTRPYGCGVDY